MDKLERLMDLTMTLLETERPLRAEEIRARVPAYPAKLESFRRAFERDKEELREMGIPLRLEPIMGAEPPADGYRIHKADYYLSDPGLESDELAALHLAAEAVHLEGGSERDLLWHLGGAIASESGAPDAGLAVVLAGGHNLTALFGALAERRTVTLEYRGTLRTVEPHRLGFQGGWWYLAAFDQLRGEIRRYRVDRIEGTVELGPSGAYERSTATEPFARGPGWELGEGPAQSARLLVDAGQAPWALDALGEGRVVERRDDGSVVFVVEVVNWPAFRSFVLGFLDHAELIAPDAWREELCEWLEAMR